MCSYECRVQSSTKINVERSENERGTWHTTVCNGKQCVIHGTRVHVTKENTKHKTLKLKRNRKVVRNTNEVIRYVTFCTGYNSGIVRIFLVDGILLIVL